MTQPLDGILVIELGTMITAPLAGMMLADLGARVIKVEHPKGGDPFRAYRGDLYSPHFSAYNRNKESIQLDLQSEAGQDKLHRLLRQADVLLDNYRPGVLDRLRLDDATLEQLNPRLVRCSITGFGDSGPYRDRPAYDSVGIAMSGLASLLVDPEEPNAAGPTIADNVTGMYACYGILGALVSRGKTGKGARISTNMLEADHRIHPGHVRDLHAARHRERAANPGFDVAILRARCARTGAWWRCTCRRPTSSGRDCWPRSSGRILPMTSASALAMRG